MTTSKSLVRVAFALALFLSPAPVLAHARLTRSEPAAGSKIGSPLWIKLWFSERPELALSSATLKDQSGKAFSLGVAQGAPGDPLQVSFALTGALPPGTYTLAWRTVPSDGHPSHGTFNFVVLAASPPTESQPQTGSAITPAPSVGQSVEEANEAGSAINSLARAFSFAGILLVIGVTVFNLLVVARSDRIGSELVGRMESRAAVVGIAASLWVILGAFTQLYLESKMMSQMADMQTMSIADMAMHTRWGFAMRLEIIAAFLTLVSFAVAIKRVRGAWLAASLFATVLALTPALGGHAAATPQFASLLIAADFLHVLGASSWLGNLACVMLIGVPIVLRSGGDERWQSVATLVNAFSPVALGSASVVIASGLVASWIHLDRFSDLWTTAYGQMLFRKLVFVALILAVGAYNFRKVQPQLIREHGTARLRRWTTTELGFAVIILVITGFLTGISP